MRIGGKDNPEKKMKRLCLNFMYWVNFFRFEYLSSKIIHYTTKINKVSSEKLFLREKISNFIAPYKYSHMQIVIIYEF